MRWFLRRLFPPAIPKPKPKYVGFVHGYSVLRRGGKDDVYFDGYWVLSEAGKKRTAKLVGDAGNSSFAIAQEAGVQCWLVGGPLPNLGDQRGGAPPKPRKTRPISKAQSNVIAFSKKAAAA